MDCEIIDTKSPLWQDVLARLPHDLYHLPEYLSLEARRTNAVAQALVIKSKRNNSDDGLFFLPYLKRDCNVWSQASPHLPEGICDVTSPYGYPGPLYRVADDCDCRQFLGRALDVAKEELRRQKVCSAFVRLHPLLNQDFADLSHPCYTKNGDVVLVDLSYSHEEMPLQYRQTVRNSIKQCQRLGMRAFVTNLSECVDTFKSIYYENMDRVKASKSYYFDHQYFVDLAKIDGVHLCLIEYEGRVQCAGIFFESNHIVQYHLSGTSAEYLSLSPSRLMLDHVAKWAKIRGNKYLMLGGGVGGNNDGLFQFKLGFSKLTSPFGTLRMIVNKDFYEAFNRVQSDKMAISAKSLSGSSYFPAYRHTAEPATSKEC